MNNDQPMKEIEQLDYQARVVVCGLKWITTADGERKLTLNTAGWSPAFDTHPWVQEANDEGWAGNLRTFCIGRVFRKIMIGADYSDVNAHMPDLKIREYWRREAARYAKAAEWQRAVVAKHGSLDAYLRGGKPQDGRSTWKNAQRPTFEGRRLSATSERITGEHNG